MRSRRRFAAPLLLAGLVACIAPHGTVQVLSPGSMELASAPVGDVKVVLAPTVPESRRRVFLEHNGEAVIRQAITDVFMQRAYWDPSSPQVLHLTVTKLKLRSTANARFNGIFSAIDILDGEAELTMGSAAPGRYTFKVSGTNDYGSSSSTRLRDLARRLSMELAQYIVPAGKGAATPAS